MPRIESGLWEGSKSGGHEAVPEAAALGRVLTHGRELGQDLLDWVDLKIQAERMKLQELLNEKLNLAADVALAIGLAGVGIFFVLVAAALGLGTWLGHPAWGFLLVGLVFLAVGAAFYVLHPTLKDLRRPALIDEARLSPDAPQGRPYLPPPAEEESDAKS